jgi:aryl-alcohol dehydrogenase-like predicted oxidoreductase
MQRSIRRAVELGINYFDTAPAYGNGASERNLGTVLSEIEAGTYVGTKVLVSREDRDSGHIRESILSSADESLRRIGRKQVDLLQLHNHISNKRNGDNNALTPEQVLGDVAEAFDVLKGRAAIRFYGLTGLGETEALHRVVGAGVFQTLQVCYNLLNPTADWGAPHAFYAQDFGNLIERAAERGVGIICIRTLAAGALSGKVERHTIAAAEVAPIGSGKFYEEDVKKANGFDFIVNEGHTEDGTEAAIRFVMTNERISTCLVGFSSLEQIEWAVTAASRGALPESVRARLPEIWGRLTDG